MTGPAAYALRAILDACRDSRKRAHLSRRQVANTLGITASLVTKVELGDYIPKLDRMLAYAAACGIALEPREQAPALHSATWRRGRNVR